MKNITILGSGSWGTALALVLADNGQNVRMWGINRDQIDEINTNHTNKNYLPDGVVLPKTIKAYNELKTALTDTEVIVFAVPTGAIAQVAKEVSKIITYPIKVVHVSKGIEPTSLKRISELITENLSANILEDLIVLSGPSHAEEVSQRLITTICATSTNLKAAEFIQKLFSNSYFRVYTNEDIVGVELAGALKNIIAIGTGIISGLNFGDNAKAALMTRGLMEITRLGIKMGASPYTFLGLTGLGDLIVTCTSVHSRNWRCGFQLGQGKLLDDIVNEMGMIVEGVKTTQAAYKLAEKYQVEMPITNTLYKVLFEKLDVKTAIEQLMTRVSKHELDTLPI